MTTDSQSREPQTEAGRHLKAWLQRATNRQMLGVPRPTIVNEIEAEAAAAARAAVAEQVRGVTVLRLSGAMLVVIEQWAATDFDTNVSAFFIDYDEWDEFVPLNIVLALLEKEP